MRTAHPTEGQPAVQRSHPHIKNLSDLLAYEAELDSSICGISLANDGETRLAVQGAHDPTPSPYFVLEQLLAHLDLTDQSHLLDVGSGTGRVMAYFLYRGFAGQATGIELDPDLASATRAWTASHPNLHMLQGSVLDIDLSPYTDFYLFNPFAPHVLQRFIPALEEQLTHPCTLIHMSDNGDTWQYVGRSGWTELASGSFQYYRTDRGQNIEVYDCPQHYTIWRYEPNDR